MTIKIIIIQVFKCFHSNNLIINPGHGCSYDNFNITISVYYFQKRKIHLSINLKILNINNKYRSEKRWAYMRYLFTILFKIFLHSVNCLLDLRVFPIAFTVAKYKPCEIKYTKRKKNQILQPISTSDFITENWDIFAYSLKKTNRDSMQTGK